MKKKAVLIGLVPVLCLAFLPSVSHAAITTVGGTCIGPIITKVINWILGIAGLLAVLMLIIGGVRYVISAGSPGQTESAKKTIIYALVGVVIIILALVLVNTVAGLLGGGTADGEGC